MFVLPYWRAVTVGSVSIIAELDRAIHGEQRLNQQVY
jgi:hypothetical protein